MLVPKGLGKWPRDETPALWFISGWSNHGSCRGQILICTPFLLTPPACVRTWTRTSTSGSSAAAKPSLLPLGSLLLGGSNGSDTLLLPLEDGRNVSVWGRGGNRGVTVGRNSFFPPAPCRLSLLVPRGSMDCIPACCCGLQPFSSSALGKGNRQLVLLPSLQAARGTRPAHQ